MTISSVARQSTQQKCRFLHMLKRSEMLASKLINTLFKTNSDMLILIKKLAVDMGEAPSQYILLVSRLNDSSRVARDGIRLTIIRMLPVNLL